MINKYLPGSWKAEELLGDGDTNDICYTWKGPQVLGNDTEGIIFFSFFLSVLWNINHCRLFNTKSF